MPRRQNGSPASNSTRFRASYATAERDREIAIYLSDRTKTGYDAADHFKMSKSAVYEAVHRAHDAVRRDGGEQYVAAQLLEIEALRHVAWGVLRSSHVMVSDGKVITDPDSELTERDWRHVLAAMRELVRLAEHEAKIKGLYAPTQSEVTVLTRDVTEQAIAELEARLAENDPPTAGPDRRGGSRKAALPAGVAAAGS